MPLSDFSRLAIDGGQPVIPEGPPPWPRPDEAVRAALLAAYADGSWGRYHGPHCDRLRDRLAEMHGAKHAWLCSSGTIAVELALRGLKIGPGHEVILAAYDFPGNFRAIEAVGARPVLVDLAAGTWTIDAAQVEEAVTAATKAVIVSHLHGSLADMPRLRKIADRHGLAIVEDACQAPLATVAGRLAGSWGDCGVLSFGGSKLLTAGRGGAIVTDREQIVQRIKVFSERGNDAFPLSELQAAVLAPQLSRLAEDNARRLEAARALIAGCRDDPHLVPLALSPGGADVPALYKLPWRTEPEVDGAAFDGAASLRQAFIAAVRAEGVAMDEGFRGFVRRTSQRCRAVGDLPNARRAAAATVLLHHPVLLEPQETIARVAAAVRKASQVLGGAT